MIICHTAVARLGAAHALSTCMIIYDFLAVLIFIESDYYIDTAIIIVCTYHSRGKWCIGLSFSCHWFLLCFINRKKTYIIDSMVYKLLSFLLQSCLESCLEEKIM